MEISTQTENNDELLMPISLSDYMSYWVAEHSSGKCQFYRIKLYDGEEPFITNDGHSSIMITTFGNLYIHYSDSGGDCNLMEDEKYELPDGEIMRTMAINRILFFLKKINYVYKNGI